MVLYMQAPHLGVQMSQQLKERWQDACLTGTVRQRRQLLVQLLEDTPATYARRKSELVTADNAEQPIQAIFCE